MSVKTFATTGTPGFFSATGYISIDDIKTVVCNSSSVALDANLPIASVAFTGSGIPASSNVIGIRGGIMTFPNGSTRSSMWGSDSSAPPGVYASIPYYQSRTISTSAIFNSSTKTSKVVDVNLVLQTTEYLYTSYTNGMCLAHPPADTVLSVIRYVLDAPPTFKVTDSEGTETTQLYFDKQFVYAGLTTASIKVANLSAKYGGSIISATLTIGDQTVSRTNNGELSILLNAGGTFTPTVTVTDSRGQTTTKTLDPITVNVYTLPTVTFGVERTLATGVPDDEGTHVVINPTFAFTDVITTNKLQEPTITAKDEGSITHTPTVTWYSSRASDGTLSDSVTWGDLSTGDTVYGLLSLQSGFDALQSYEISVTPIDSEGTGITKTQMLAPAFFTIDVLAGGHGIAFGKPASNEGFECAMDVMFEASVGLELDDNDGSGADYRLLSAFARRGWTIHSDNE